jgi:hypothetical protein
MDLIFEEGKVAGPKPFMKSRADLVCPDSGKDLYPLGLSFTKPEHDIKSEGASTF